MCGVLTAPHSRGPLVCWFERRHFFLSFNLYTSVSFFFLPFFCSHGSSLLRPRCCPGRRVVCSHTPSSTRITQAVQMNWTSSSMEESSFSLSYWTLWVKYISTAITCTRLETNLTGCFELKYHRGVGQGLFMPWLKQWWLQPAGARTFYWTDNTEFSLICKHAFCEMQKRLLTIKMQVV